jgi:N-acylneuraminate cytidylyltransferase
MANIAIIPARGGSKRIPRKNIKEFLGKPIIAYSIEAALNSGLFDEVMVSTEDYEIADVAKEYGANVPFMRSQKNADDYVGIIDVVKEVINEYKKLGQAFDFTCCIFPTAPLIQIKRIKEGLELMRSENYHRVLPIVKFNYPIFRSLKRNDDGSVEMYWPENKTKRSQDLPNAYHDAGQFYWIKTSALDDNFDLFGKNTGAIVLSSLEIQDIDDYEDWKMAELKAKLISA